MFVLQFGKICQIHQSFLSPNFCSIWYLFHACVHYYSFVHMKHTSSATLYTGLMVKTPYSAITILQGDEITLSCTPSQSNIALQWSYNGSDISSSSYCQFTPPYLNHDLTIPHASDTDSGQYTFKSGIKVLEDAISLTVVPSKCKYI